MTEEYESFDAVEWKIREAEFFLEHMRSANEAMHIIDVCYYFSAFVSAARSITFCLQVVMSGVRDFDAWLGGKRSELAADPLARFYVNRRNRALKRAEEAIGSVEATRQPNGSYETRHYFFDEVGDELGTPGKKKDVIATAEQYLDLLRAVVADCRRQFSRVIEPVDLFNPDALASRGISLEDVEEVLGFERGAFARLGDDKRLDLLRHCAPPRVVEQWRDRLEVTHQQPDNR